MTTREWGWSRGGEGKRPSKSDSGGQIMGQKAGKGGAASMRGSLKLTRRRVLQQDVAGGMMEDMGRDDDEAAPEDICWPSLELEVA